MKKTTMLMAMLCSFSAAATYEVPKNLEMFRILDMESGLCLAPKDLNAKGAVSLSLCSATNSYWVNLGGKVAPIGNTKLALYGDVESLFLSSESAVTIREDGSLRGAMDSFESEVCVDRWTLPLKWASEDQNLHYLIECEYADQDPNFALNLMKGDGEIHPWNKDVTYDTGDTVIYQGKTWMARWNTRDSEPLEGEYDWHPWVEVK